jgi:FkbM family methyltransferase
MSADGTISVMISGGAKICVPDSVALITPYVLLEQEDWFEDEVRFVRRLLRPGMAAVDVGASFGIFSMAMARAVGAQGKVWAFEPTPGTAEFLQATLALNEAHQVNLTRAAVSDQPGSVQFITGPNSELNAIAHSGEAGDAVLTVPSLTLDQAAADHSWRDVDFVKLDVEGHELQVIAGGRSFFTTASPLVMFEIRASEGVDLRPLAAFQAMGYEVYRLAPGPMLLAPFAAGQAVDSFTLNLFACKPDRAQRLAAEGFLAAGDSATAVPAKDAWRNYLEAAPYARDVAEGWPSKPRLFSATHTKTYLQALALFAQSRDLQCNGALRLSLLRRAAELVAAASQEQDTLPRLLTSARLAWELGRRAFAVQLLESAGRRVKGEGASVYHEPFLAPSVRYEQLATGVPTEEWVHCAVVEQWERLRHFSSFYAGTSSLPLLEAIAGLPYRSAEMERRRQLIRMLAGMQNGREANPLVCQQSEEHLNPVLWCGADRS